MKHYTGFKHCYAADLPLAVEIEKETHARNTLCDLIETLEKERDKWQQAYHEARKQIESMWAEKEKANPLIVARLRKVEAELKAERQLRASIAADLRNISEQFNNIIAS